MPQEMKDWADSYAKSLKSMPQDLKVPEMDELMKYGGLGTPLKERIALSRAHKESSSRLNSDLALPRAA
jgi:hypothetical protein